MKNKLSLVSFKSVFGKYLFDFIDYKKALGYKYESESYLLLCFDKMCIDAGIVKPVLDENIVSQWINQNEHHSFHTIYQRKSIIKMFALYLNNHGIKAYIPISRPDNRASNNFIPYIFTQEQAKLLIKMSYQTIEKRGTSTMYLDFPLIINLLYGTGMRVSEVLNLKLTDIDLIAGVVLVQDSKFKKSRLIPLSNSLRKLCINYYKEVHYPCSKSKWFFSNIYQEKYTRGTIYARFRKLLKICQIPHGYNGPRLHDLRHTFAVHSLQKLICDDKDIYVSLPILSEYLGHSNIYSTEKYLRLTAEIYPEISEKSKFLIPEVDPNETY